jgi:hypothetical protein
MSMKRASLILLTLALLLAAAWTIAPGRSVAAADDDPQQHGYQHAAHTAHGDPIVINRLVKSAGQATQQRPRAVLAALEAGKSIAQIAQEQGASVDAVLARFDRQIDRAMAQAVSSQRLPQSVADSRAAWFKQSARLQIDQPGLQPRFPGLHEVHVIMISAAVDVSALPRRQIRQELERCRTLADIVAITGTSGADVASAAMVRIDALLQQSVDAGELTTAERDAWRAALQTTAATMTATPGLHVAGKACAK